MSFQDLESRQLCFESVPLIGYTFLGMYGIIHSWETSVAHLSLNFLIIKIDLSQIFPKFPMEFLVFIEMENLLVKSRRLICKNARSAIVFLLSQHTVLIVHFDIHNNLVVLYF